MYTASREVVRVPIRLINVDPLFAFPRIKHALEILEIVAPLFYNHFMSVMQGISYSRNGCAEGARACTAGRYGRTAVLTIDPAHDDMIELIVSLSHESRHFRIDSHEKLRLYPHSCGECRDEKTQARDKIYQEDAWLRNELRYWFYEQEQMQESIDLAIENPMDELFCA